MENLKPRILYVDDDQENLRTFRRIFRKYYEVLLAESGAEALEILQTQAPIPVIITDQRMPEMTGIEFLDHSIRLSPESIRIIITGFTDVQALIDAINMGRVYRYITKPWDEQELYVTIKRAVESYELKIRNTQLLSDLQRKHEELEQSYQALQTAQEKLIQSEKLASIGRLASRIAHELRNPIQAIRMGIEVFKHDLAENPAAAEIQALVSPTLQHIDQEIIAVNTIIQDLLEYAREMKFEFTSTDINNLIEGVLFNLAETLAARAIHVETHYGEIGEVIVDGIRVRQAIINIVQNAIEAIGQDGRLTITTTTRDAATISITVQDTGCGLTEEAQQRMFEPFFTTKEQGTGLGMSIVHRILEAHHGSIEVASQPGQGATLTLALPREHPALPAEHAVFVRNVAPRADLP